MEEAGVYDRLSILDVLAVWPCARAIFEHVPVRDLVRSERVSRDWQHAVHDYLQTSSNLKLNSGFFSYLDESDHRTIEIEDNDSPWEVLRKTTEKLGCYIVSLNTDCGDEEHVRIIESNCPHLHHIGFYDTDNINILKKFENFKQLKQVSLIDVKNMTDLLLLHPFQATKFEKIAIEESEISGNFLKYIRTRKLISLSLKNCPKLYTGEFQYIADNLHNVTSLELDQNGVKLLEIIHELLTRMPQLESLSLRKYEPIESSANLLESLSCLTNLKRLDMADNQNVNDEFIEVVVRECRNLEYLNITNAYECCTSSLAALCRRPPPAVTTFSMGHIKNYTSDDLEFYVKWRSVIPELEAMGCVKLTPQWLETTARASQGREHPLEVRSAHQPGGEQTSRELKIILDSTYVCMWHIMIEGITVDEVKKKCESI